MTSPLDSSVSAPLQLNDLSDGSVKFFTNLLDNDSDSNPSNCDTTPGHHSSEVTNSGRPSIAASSNSPNSGNDDDDFQSDKTNAQRSLQSKLVDIFSSVANVEKVLDLYEHNEYSLDTKNTIELLHVITFDEGQLNRFAFSSTIESMLLKVDNQFRSLSKGDKKKYNNCIRKIRVSRANRQNDHTTHDPQDRETHSDQKPHQPTIRKINLTTSQNQSPITHVRAQINKLIQAQPLDFQSTAINLYLEYRDSLDVETIVDLLALVTINPSILDHYRNTTGVKEMINSILREAENLSSEYLEKYLESVGRIGFAYKKTIETMTELLALVITCPSTLEKCRENPGYHSMLNCLQKYASKLTPKYLAKYLTSIGTLGYWSKNAASAASQFVINHYNQPESWTRGSSTQNEQYAFICTRYIDRYSEAMAKKAGL